MDNVSTGYAGLWGRLAAHFVDVAITLSVLVLHGLTFRILRAAGIWNPAGYGSASAVELWESYGALAKCAVVVAFVIATGLIYFPVFEASPWQATPGKRQPYASQPRPCPRALAGEVVFWNLWRLVCQHSSHRCAAKPESHS